MVLVFLVLETKNFWFQNVHTSLEGFNEFIAKISNFKFQNV